MPASFTYDVFLSHCAKDKAVVRPFDSLSASNGERARVRCRNLHLAEWMREDDLLTTSQLSTFNSQPFGGSA